MTNAAIKEMIEGIDAIAKQCLKDKKKVRKDYIKRTGKKPRSELKMEFYYRAQVEVLQLVSESLAEILNEKRQ